LLRILNLLERPSDGIIYFYGSQVKNNGKFLLDLRRKMTMVFQRPMLFSMPVLDNVAYGLTARGVGKKAARQEAARALAEVGLEEFAWRNARSLSGGEAQRVALARATVLKPEVLLLDEPTSNLDPANVALIEKITGELNREYGTTVIMVTHNIFQARRLAREVLFLYKGELLEKGPTESVFNDPKDERTRAFISGEMVY